MAVKLEFWLGLLLVVFSVMVFKFVKVFKRKREDNVPTVQLTRFPFPLLDALIFYAKFRKLGVSLIDELCERYSESVIQKLNLGFKSVYHVGDLDLIQKLLKSSTPGHLHKPKEVYDLVFYGPLSKGLVAASLDIWTPHRKAISHAFTYKSLTIYLRHTNTCCQEMLKYALSSSKKGGCLNHHEVGELLDFYGFKLMTLIVMGTKCHSLSSTELTMFSDSLRVAKEIIVARALNPILLLPPVWYFSNKRKVMESSVSQCVNFVHDIIKRYQNREAPKTPELSVDPTGESEEESEGNKEEYVGTKEPVECILEQLLKANMPPDEIVNEVCSFLVVGYETVRAAFDMILFQLALHPEYQQRCQAEVDELFSTQTSHDTTFFSMDDLNHLKFLEQCILESLRLTPTLPIFFRRMEEPLQVSTDWSLQQGDIVIVSPWYVHRSSRNFENPTKFDPDRFLAENVKSRHPYSFLSFSMGLRNCVGWKVAIMKMKMFLAWILRHYDVSTTDKPEDVTIFFDVTIRLERPYNIMYQRRS